MNPPTCAVLLLMCSLGVGAMDQEYCELTPKHTMCRYKGAGPACGPLEDRGLSEKESMEIVDYHNRLRSRVASGQTNQPPASNMLQLQWDPELAKIAQRLADQCKFMHDCPDCRQVKRFSVGQNIYQSFNTRSGLKNDWIPAIDSWFDEIKMFPPTSVKKYQFSHATGHYSQMLWATTSRIGCGVTAFRSGRFNSRLYVCNYGEGGNVLRQEVYKIGRGCGECPASCSNDYPNLCTKLPGKCNSFRCMLTHPVEMVGHMAMDTAHMVGDNAMALGHGVGDTAMQVGHTAMEFGHAFGGTAMQVGHAVGDTAMRAGHTAMDTLNLVVDTGIRPVNSLFKPFLRPFRFPSTFLNGKK